MVTGNSLTRRAALAGAVGLVAGPARAATAYEPSAALVAAARKEGRVVFYTANTIEFEQEIIGAFRKRFPFVQVEMVRASGGQLITRIKTEAATGKLVADVVTHSDRGLLKDVADLFRDYAPPNAADYLPSSLVSPKLWPRTTAGWCIAWNSELVKSPILRWSDLCRPEHAGGKIGQVIAGSGGTTWTRVMFERQVLGETYWAQQAATKPQLFVSNAPLSDALVRGEVEIAPILHYVVFPKKRDGAPIEMAFPAEGVPLVPFAAGIPKTSVNPNAAQLFLDWGLSEEGQTFCIRELGSQTSLKTPPVIGGFEPAASQVWLPDFQQFETLQTAWTADWNKTYGYRQ
jgi:iron(III) transport system substrate-binding protein